MKNKRKRLNRVCRILRKRFPAGSISKPIRLFDEYYFFICVEPLRDGLYQYDAIRDIIKPIRKLEVV
jgi:hypothetical protein